ncbi:unnamed protein product [Strongylus vulgaris]|uniref:3'-5' exonuclease domain-containing protein n=1 Tax=Strongylus vulgaris TaxID=40348 RepID=A0A3P7ICR0_STRVU|nr:unnamed protein product [Strongylus vulgaris]
MRGLQVTLVKNRPSEDGSENGSDEGDLESNNNSVFPLDQNALARIHFVKALKPAQELVERLWQDINTQEKKVVGLDFKTVTVGIDGELFLSLCVVATQSQIGVFDLASSDVIIMESGLRDILESDKVTKVNWTKLLGLPALPMESEFEIPIHTISNKVVSAESI